MRTFCIVVGLLVYSVSGVAQFASDLRIVHEDARSATIEFIPIFFASVSDRGQHELETAASARFKFSGYLVDHAKPGMPIDLFRAVNILLPTRRYALHVLASEYEDVSGVQPYIAPALKGDEFGFIQTPNDAAPLAPEKMSRRDVAELIAVAPDHGEYIGTLRLYPVQYSADGYSARVYRRIVVRIDFDSRRAGVSVDPSRRKATAVIERTGAVASVSDSPLAQGEWYRLDVRETGIYKLDQNFLSRNNIPLSQVGNMNTIRIFGNDGTELPEDIAAPRPDGLEEVPRHIIDRNGNGVLESDDAVLFYGKSTSGWTYAPQQKTYNHYINHYTETNSYFLTFGGAPGKAMDSLVSTSLAGAYAPADYQGKHFVEEELFNHGQNGVSSGREWIGRQFDDATRSQTFTALLSGVDATKPALYRYVLLSRSTTTDSYSIFENDQQLGSPVLTFPIDVTSITDDKYHRTPVVTATRTGSYPNDRSVLRFTFNSSNASALGWVDWFEILYRRRFEAVSDSMLFTSPDTTANVEYRLSKFTSRDVRVFDVTDHRNVKHISNVTFDPADATVCRFQLPQTQGSAREFVAVGANGYETPVAVTKVANSNLHGVADGADFIILSPPEFLPAANRLKAHREQPGDEYLKTLVVNVESMFNEFSSGVLDPMAIRDFLRYATTQWSRKPQYVL
ncbi:MAG TPA: C25 family cysteine peptidase, partial [Bacteroidota bacterium]